MWRYILRQRWRKCKLKVCSRTRAHTGRTTDRRHRQRDLHRLKRCRHLQDYGGELGSSTNNIVLIIRGRARHCLHSLVAVSLRREICDYVGHALRSKFLDSKLEIMDSKLEFLNSKQTRNLGLETRNPQFEIRVNALEGRIIGLETLKRRPREFIFMFNWHLLSILNGLDITWRFYSAGISLLGAKLRDFGRKWPPKRQMRAKYLLVAHFFTPNGVFWAIVREIIFTSLACAGAQEKRQNGRKEEKSQEVYISRMRGAPLAGRFQPNLANGLSHRRNQTCNVSSLFL